VIKNYNWITNGNYFSTQDLRLPLSDTIIIFDYPLRIVYRRLLKRRWVYRNAKRPDMPDDWQESLNLAFIRSHVLGFRKKYRSQAVPILELLPESIEVVTFKKPKQARQYLASIK
jgi:adenylate kinase family enzyme